MARQSLQKAYADFRKGWVTVNSPLKQPEGSVKDIVNFDINTDGTITKREGLIKTGQTYPVPPNASSDALRNKLYIWESVGNDVNKTFAVLLSEDNLVRVYDISSSNLDIDSESHVATISMPNNFGNFTGSKASSGVSAIGKFFIASARSGAVYLEYDSSSDSVSLKEIDIEIRDLNLWRGPTDKETGLETYTDYYLNPWHEYNLRNSGWPEKADVSKDKNPNDGIYSQISPEGYTKNFGLKAWPKISIPFLSAKAGGGNDLEEQNAYNPWAIKNDYFGNTQPIVGRKIINTRSFTRTGAIRYAPSLNNSSAIDGYHKETYNLTEGVSCVSFYSGRLWYAGNGSYSSNVSTSRPKDPLTNEGVIYFSQVIGNDLSKAGKCYQANDPTAEDINQLLATDGGYIAIKEAGNIRSIVSLGTSLFVFSDQGVWKVSGKDSNSFNADSYSVEKITDNGVLSERAVVVSKDIVFFVTDKGLFGMSGGSALEKGAYQDLSSGLIKDFFVELSSASVANSMLKFDDDNNLLYCFFAIPQDDGQYSEDFFNTKYNTILIFSQDLGCFYKYELNKAGNYSIYDATFELDASLSRSDEPVVDSAGNAYFDSSGDIYTLPSSLSFSKQANKMQLLIYKDGEMASYTFNDSENYQDIGEEFEAEVEIGFDIIGNLISDKMQAPMLVAYMNTYPNNDNVFAGFKEV